MRRQNWLSNRAAVSIDSTDRVRIPGIHLARPGDISHHSLPDRNHVLAKYEHHLASAQSMAFEILMVSARWHTQIISHKITPSQCAGTYPLLRQSCMQFPMLQPLLLDRKSEPQRRWSELSNQACNLTCECVKAKNCSTNTSSVQRLMITICAARIIEINVLASIGPLLVAFITCWARRAAITVAEACCMVDRTACSRRSSVYTCF